jgi:tetratricopeptide (TPR) repeat protein
MAGAGARFGVVAALISIQMMAGLALALPAGPGEQGLRPSQVKPNITAEQERLQTLARLYGELESSKAAEQAERIATDIERIWLDSGSATVDLLVERAGYFVQNEEPDLALRVLDTVVSIDPDYAEGWYERAMVHFIKEDFRRALTDLRQALALEPQHFKAIVALGAIMQELGNKKAALDAYRRALRVHPFLPAAKQAVEELKREVEGQDT